MNFKARLSRVQNRAPEATVESGPPALSSLRKRIAEIELRGRNGCSAARCGAPAPRSDDDALARALTGHQVADGLIRIAHRVPLDHRLGNVHLSSLQPQPKLPGELPEAARRYFYLDTETTGLSGGSGTVAFLIGCAVVAQDAIEVTQFLITRFGAEPDMLSAFADTLKAGDCLVSYNGKSYDVPLLSTRYRMHSMGQPFAAFAHLDLLHPVRRLFARRWHDCRLSSAERELLGFGRVDDLPGSEAPAAWFGYVRSAISAPLIRTVQHNRQDLVSLAVVHSVLGEAVTRPQAFGVDLYALGRWLADHSEHQARHMLQANQHALCEDGLRLLANLWRRTGDWPQALRIWEALAATGCTESLQRLAKYHEHVSKDLDAAMRCCTQLSADAAHERRRERLAIKLKRPR